MRYATVAIAVLGCFLASKAPLAATTDDVK